MPIEISDEALSNLGQMGPNLDFATLDRIEKMEYGKAKTASVLDPQTNRDVSNQVKRQLSTLGSKIGRKLKYYNRKDFPNQIPEGRVGFEVVGINTSTPEVQAVLQQLNEWRASQNGHPASGPTTPAPGSEVGSENPSPTPDVQESVQHDAQPTRGNRR